MTQKLSSKTNHIEQNKTNHDSVGPSTGWEAVGREATVGWEVASMKVGCWENASTGWNEVGREVAEWEDAS